MESSKVDAAVAAFEAALVAEPQMLEAQNAIGQIHHKAGRYLQAIEAFETALQINSGALPVRINLALSHSAHGDTIAARAAWKLVQALDPSHRLARHWLQRLQ
ncbi:MAG: tetratricopeptide repeat protein [Gemmatimonadetes bacterium]|jgi:tetratricopeptide (TPR) repeat protein|nr:tetratricopeptide repeat protein [Gemmatimonadota bacterium]MBT5142622.1 tetratricopeptide repeat protein [Gemmatimonadota bacterium]